MPRRPPPEEQTVASGVAAAVLVERRGEGGGGRGRRGCHGETRHAGETRREEGGAAEGSSGMGAEESGEWVGMRAEMKPMGGDGVDEGGMTNAVGGPLAAVAVDGW
ncbi:hypothetical protein E2562_034191 [Oryza meyeriana var. granulata]|uniref:DUF834 domain-containing protein n=1 Tax=Oryza meyeriana var. granulata TaxID=110450 RepID=A0A6G1F193_9ORYZ|nr:hypothetical protein E2562_034191 [Oryza meyeriana var. granulata]